MYLGSMDPGQECLNPKYRTSSIQVQIPVPGRNRTISPVPLLDLQAVPMKDTEGAVVTFEFFCISDSQNRNVHQQVP